MFQVPAVSNVCQVFAEAYSEFCPICKVGLFCENSSRLSPANYSWKNLYLQWFRRFWIRLWIALCDSFSYKSPLCKCINRTPPSQFELTQNKICPIFFYIAEFEVKIVVKYWKRCKVFLLQIYIWIQAANIFSNFWWQF